MRIRDIFIAMGFEIDENSERNAENSIKGLKDFAFKALGAIGIGFSLASMNALAEEFNGINDQIKNATKDLGDQAEIQDKILKAANDTKMSYGDTAKVVSSLVQENSELFGNVDDAIAFNNATTKLFMTAGKGADQIAGLQESINKSFAKGAVDSETINQLMEQSPEAVKLLNKQLGTTTDQLVKMASDGKIKLSDLRDAFVNNAEEINKNFDELDYSISDAMLNIRNQWGKFLDSLNAGSGLTQSIAKGMVKAFTKLMDLLKKMQPTLERIIKIGIRGATLIGNGLEKVGRFIERVVKKIGGAEVALKLLATVGGAIFAVLNAGKILGFLKSVGKLLGAINLKTLLIIAAVVAVALIVEDFINFMQGNDSVIGEMFKKAGIDADAAREKIKEAWANVKESLLPLWEKLKEAGSQVFGALKDFWDKHGDSIVAVVAYLVTTLIGLIGPLLDYISGIITFLTGVFSGDWEMVWEGIKQMFQACIDVIITIWNNLPQGIKDKIIQIKDIVVDGFQGAIDYIKSLPDKAKQWGKDFIDGLVSGITGSIGKVADGVKGIANKVKSFLHFSVPDEGPLTDYQDWMPDFVKGLANGIQDNMPLIEGAVSDMSKLMAAAVQVPSMTVNTAAGAGGRSNTVNQNNSIVNQFTGYDRKTQLQAAGAMQKSARDITDYMAAGLNYGR